MQCILVLIADALAGLFRIPENHVILTLETDHDERIPLFLKTSESDPDLPYLPLLRQVMAYTEIDRKLMADIRTLDTQDEFVQLKAAQILTTILRYVANRSQRKNR
jgi:V-type H+-transporting ATPase subunit H